VAIQKRCQSNLRHVLTCRYTRIPRMPSTSTVMITRFLFMESRPVYKKSALRKDANLVVLSFLGYVGLVDYQFPPANDAVCCGLAFLGGLELTLLAGVAAGLDVLAVAVAAFICARFLALKSRTICAI
jgi:hypothetical protein